MNDKKVIFIRLNRPYLKEFLAAIRDCDGNPVYGTEPFHFGKRTTIGRIIEANRFAPTSKSPNVQPDVFGSDRANFIAIEIRPDLGVKGDKYRTQISAETAQRVETAIYDMFCRYCFTYVEDHLLCQRQDDPLEKPCRKRAFIDFIQSFELSDPDCETLRRAYDRFKDDTFRVVAGKLADRTKEPMFKIKLEQFASNGLPSNDSDSETIETSSTTKATAK